MRPTRTTPRPALSEPLERRVLLTGLTGQYFDRVDFTDLKLTRTDSTVAFNWGSAAPTASMGSDNFAVRWTGQVQPQYSEDYTFYVKSDDGARLWVDGRLILDNWVNQSATERSATLPLTAGRMYDIRLDYYDATSSAQVTLSWSSRSQAKQTIPSSRLFPSPAGLVATYFDNPDFTGTSDARTDPAVDFNWGTGSPDPAGGIAPGTYSATWTGQVIPQYSQTYTFFVTPDAGAIASLRVDRQLVFSTSSNQTTAQVQLEAGKRYDIELTYAHASSAGASLKLEWSSPSQPRQVVPTSRLVASKLGVVPTSKPAYTNPATDKNWPDPGVLYSDGYYWMTHTTGGPSNGWPLYQSTDLLHWTFVKNLLTSSNRPAFMDDGAFWAPEFHKVNGQYVLTGTARSTQYADKTVIAIATAPEITGPYTVRSTPIVASSTSGTLDSTVFQDWDGRVYLIWKRQSNSGTAANGSIRMQELDPSNLTQFAPGSTEVTLLNNAGGGAWEHGIEEAPEMIHRGSYYYLFYSGSTINTTYAVGVARATSLTGTYTRYPGNVPILQSNATWGGPGHGAFLQDDDGTWWFYYHARHQDNPDFGRVQMLDKVVWSADAWPTFGNGGTPTTTPQAGPRVDAPSGTGRYTVTGDVGGVAADDVIRVVRNASDPSLLDVLVNGVAKLSVPFAEIETLTLNGGLGNDTLLLDYSRGECVPGSGVTFAASSGTDTVQIVGASATDAFHLTAGRLTHGTGAVTYSLADRLVLQTGTFSLDADLNAVPLQADGADTTILFTTPTQHLGAVTLADAAARFAATSGFALSVASLTITGAGTLDLADNAMVIDYTSTSPFAAVRAMLYTGRAGGTWAGTGIVSSTAAASPNRGIGLAEATSLGVTSWAGLPVGTTAILLTGAITGDANLDGRLTGDDFALADRGRARHLSSWVAGDFDYDGTVTDADLALLTQSFAAASSPPAPTTPAPTATTAVPPPAPAADQTPDPDATTSPSPSTPTTAATTPTRPPKRKHAHRHPHPHKSAPTPKAQKKHTPPITPAKTHRQQMASQRYALFSTALIRH